MKSSVVLLAVLLSACGYSKVYTQKFFFDTTVFTIEQNLAKSTLQMCGYNLYQDPPAVVEVEDGHPRYNTRHKTVYMPRRAHDESLIHEYMHHLNRSTQQGYVSWKCLDEVSAQLIKRIYLQQVEIRLLTQFYRSKMN